MLRFLLLCCILLFNFYISGAQAPVLTPAQKKQLQLSEDTLREYAEYIVTDSLTEDRMISDSIFIRTLVRALQVKNSFYYPFDSVRGISKLYAPDSIFRIITWNIVYDEYYSRQRGAIQMRTKDGSLKLYPLRDVSEFTPAPMDSVRTKDNWIGAVYYSMVKTAHAGKNYYTLFGIDYNNVKSEKKWMEILSFAPDGSPRFGGLYFDFSKDSIPQKTQYRYMLEYKKNARVLLKYDNELGIVITDHLITENEQPELRWTYVPDGDTEGFKWVNGKWQHIEKVFNFKLEDGEAPIEKPVYGPVKKTPPKN